jgi:endonuclease/exonuclease/phosphatase (EEP) superfamily protein YafD
LELLEAGDAGHAFIAARVEVAGAPITVVAVHTWAPFRLGSGRLWRESFDILAELIERLEGPVVAAGDFNATLGHRPLREFLATTGLRDAHTAAGRGLARSWPVTRLAPTLGLIDRVAISEELSVAGIEERPMPGSDHRAVIADLLVRPGSPG